MLLIDGQFKVSPSKIQRFSTGTTPGKSILKNASAPNTRDKNNDSRVRSSLKKSSNICFSPFNGVKVITHRSDMMEYGDDLWIANILSENENDDDEYSYCEDESDEEEEEDDDDDDNDDDDDDENDENDEYDNNTGEMEMDIDEQEEYVYDYPIEYDVEL